MLLVFDPPVHNTYILGGKISYNKHGRVILLAIVKFML